MEALKSVLDAFFDFKAYVMLPIIVLILALIIRMKVRDALLSALKLAAGFAGIFIAFEFFVEAINPAVEALVTERGLDFPILDVGWPPLAAITWGSPVAHISIPLIILINVLMLATNAAKTIYIDIWNYWHFALVGALIFSTSGNVIIGLIATGLLAIYTIKLSDWTAPEVERETGREGIAISPLSSVGLLPYGVGVNWLLDRIPGVRNIDYNPHKRGDKHSVFGEPMVIGFLIGVVLGVAAGYGAKNLLETAVLIAAVMFLLPKSGGLIGDGMEPVSHTLRSVIQRRFPKKKNLNIALDAAVILDHRSILTAGLILMPISLIIALILPGNKMLPLGGLPALISQISVITLISRGNVFRAVVAGIPLVTGYLLIATKLAPLITRLSQEVGAEIPTTAQITAFTDGGNPVRYWFLELFRGNPVAFVIIPVVALLFFLSHRRYKQEMAAGSSN
ncbi:MAG: PTS galactitol transporter subunit IIC [Spirochaetales bacterium]|nr:PTS galactitol transporter subunit IIC [Spirochaetales bacterium]MCF7939346.1 PTS galactitol transporter subunit IIC [Spirochaetales bacterium]